VDQGGVVTAGDVGTANGAFEQYVADQRDLPGSMKKGDMSRGMAWAVIDLQSLIPDADFITLFQPLVRFAGGAAAKAEHADLM
jgi:hypothetical protein